MKVLWARVTYYVGTWTLTVGLTLQGFRVLGLGVQGYNFPHWIGAEGLEVLLGSWEFTVWA